MSSTIYQRVENTQLSDSALLGNVSVSGFEQMMLQVALEPQANLTMANSDLNFLTYDNWVTAITAPGGLGVDVSAVTGAARNLRIFSDAADTVAFAQNMIGLFDLSSDAAPVVGRFRISGRNLTGAGAVDLNNGGSGHTYVNVRNFDGTSDAAEQTLLPNSGPLGAVNPVEIFATNFTSGSEVVVFRVGSLEYNVST